MQTLWHDFVLFRISDCATGVNGFLATRGAVGETMSYRLFSKKVIKTPSDERTRRGRVTGGDAMWRAPPPPRPAPQRVLRVAMAGGSAATRRCTGVGGTSLLSLAYTCAASLSVKPDAHRAILEPRISSHPLARPQR